MRQAGIIAAAALYALEHHVERLAEDHANAQILAEAVEATEGLALESGPVETNLVWIEVDPALGTAAEVAARLRGEGVLVSALGPQVLRACTHLDVSRGGRAARAEAIRGLAGVAATRRTIGVACHAHSPPLGPHPHRSPQAPDRAGPLGRHVDPADEVGRHRRGGRLDGQYDKDLAAAVVVVRADTFEVIERAGVVRPITYPVRAGPALVPRDPGAAGSLRETHRDPVRRRALRRPGRSPTRGGWGSPATWGSGSTGRRSGAPRVGSSASSSSRGRGGGIARGCSIGTRVIGEVVRTKDRVAPLFVSPGHRCDFESAVALVLATSGKYRLPGPARMAHEFVNEVRRGGRDV